MYDFDEFLARGIIAARSGRYAQARKSLDVAAQIDPCNPRAWLWRATIAETAQEKRDCLERALLLAPSNWLARALLARLDENTQAFASHPAGGLAIFTCPNCGGKQRFDPDLLGLMCESCGHLDVLRLANASKAEKDLAAGLGSGNWAMLDSQASCQACGATLLVPAEHATLSCPFCASDQVVLVPATPNLIRPTAIGPFLLHSEDVHQILHDWWKNPFYMPAQGAVSLSPLYLPFWTFDGQVQVRCALDRRIEPTEYSNTERVLLLEDGLSWSKPWYECDLDDFIVYAARSLPEEAVDELAPFELKSLFEYRPAILAGWQAELYQLALEDAAVQAHKQMRDLALKMAAQRLLFIEPSKLLQDDVRILDRTYKLILLPVWVVHYTFQGKRYRAFVNGQTGKVGGVRPRNWLALLLAFLGSLVVLAILAWLLRTIAG